MFLFIDTAEDETKVALYNKKGDCLDLKIWQSRKNQSEELLSKIDKLLKSNKFNQSKITGIIVNCGPGSYTGLRVGLSTANALAYSLNIPILGIKNGGNDAKIRKIIQNSCDKSFKQLALPLYKYPPKITKQKDRPQGGRYVKV